jgi:hypothetical protein
MPNASAGVQFGAALADSHAKAHHGIAMRASQALNGANAHARTLSL